jgi:hypothetical protein
LKLRNFHYVHITTVCTVSYLIYWNHEIINIFISPQFSHSDTCSIDTLNCSLCSYHHSLHSQVLVLLKRWTAHCVHITTVCTAIYLFYWYFKLHIIFILSEFAHSVTYSNATPKYSLCSYQQSLLSQLHFLLKPRNSHYVQITRFCTVSYLF